MDRFIARENIKHYRRELENGLNKPTRATMLTLLGRGRKPPWLHT
jgi:hypothetical protein